MNKNQRFNQSGQALVEYLFVLMFLTIITYQMVGEKGLFTSFMRDSMGNLGHVLTTNLMTGTCANDCFFAGYRNGYRK